MNPFEFKTYNAYGDRELKHDDGDGDKLFATVIEAELYIKTKGQTGAVALSAKQARKFAKAILAEFGE